MLVIVVRIRHYQTVRLVRPVGFDRTVGCQGQHKVRQTAAVIPSIHRVVKLRVQPGRDSFDPSEVYVLQFEYGFQALAVDPALDALDDRVGPLSDLIGLAEADALHATVPTHSVCLYTFAVR